MGGLRGDVVLVAGVGYYTPTPYPVVEFIAARAVMAVPLHYEK